MPRESHTPRTLPTDHATPFDTVEDAWFWFMEANAARQEGARFGAGRGLVARPCEPMDVLRVVDRLYRNRRLFREHLLVLAHYGRRHMPPDPHRRREMRAHVIWSEAIDRISPVLREKGIVA